MAYHHGDLREALLAAAEQLLREQGGPGGVTLRACARRAGVSHAAPQHHFRDLSDLLAELASRGFERLSEALRAALEQVGDDPQARFVAVARTYVGFARESGPMFRLMFRSDVLNAGNASLRSAAVQTYAAMTDSVALQSGAPRVAVDDLSERIREPVLMEDILLAWSHLHGFALLLLEGQLDVFRGGAPEAEFVARMLERTAVRVSGLLRRDVRVD